MDMQRVQPGSADLRCASPRRYVYDSLAANDGAGDKVSAQFD